MFPIHPFAVFRCDHLEADKKRAPRFPVAVTPDMKAAANYYAKVIQPIVNEAAWVFNKIVFGLTLISAGATLILRYTLVWRMQTLGQSYPYQMN